MQKEKKKSKKSFGSVIGKAIMLLCGIALGIACGVVMAVFVDGALGGDAPTWKIFLSYGLLLLWLYAAWFIHTALHEAGHLVCGLVSGYGFASYRIGSFMWVAGEDRLRFKRFSLAGTAGQCLMTPPKADENGFRPFVLYNLGGVLMNGVLSLLAILAALLGIHWAAKAALWVFALVGLVTAAVNGIPLRLGGVDNDGRNIRSMKASAAAQEAFFTQLAVNEAGMRGVRTKDMPKEWFAMPAEGLENSLIAAQAVMAYNRRLDERDYEGAMEIAKELLRPEYKLMGLMAAMLKCDMIFCALLFPELGLDAEELLDKQQRSVMKQMKTMPSVLRTFYTIEKLQEKDEAKAAKTLAAFEKAAARYPSPADIESEREMLALVDSAA